MKIQFFSIMIAGVATTSSLFGADYKMAGCGLGSMVIKQDGIIQVVAATLNSTGGNQTFGISSGTSNCLPANKLAKLKQQEEFFASNFSVIAKETAQGEGETLKALTGQLGCKAESYDSFRNLMKSNYDDIFAAPGAVTALNRTKHLMRGDSKLASNCADLI